MTVVQLSCLSNLWFASESQATEWRDEIRIYSSWVILCHLMSFLWYVHITHLCKCVLICLFLYAHKHSYVLYSIAHCSVQMTICLFFIVDDLIFVCHIYLQINMICKYVLHLSLSLRWLFFLLSCHLKCKYKMLRWPESQGRVPCAPRQNAFQVFACCWEMHATLRRQKNTLLYWTPVLLLLAQIYCFADIWIVLQSVQSRGAGRMCCRLLYRHAV